MNKLISNHTQEKTLKIYVVQQQHMFMAVVAKLEGLLVFQNFP